MQDGFGRLYERLRAQAERALRGERAGHTLQPTALVHEVLMRLGLPQPADDAARAGLYRAAAVEMRRVLVDHARRRASLKRGEPLRLSLVEAEPAFEVDAAEFLAVDEALQRLEEEDARAAEVVRLRFFAGLDMAATARVLGTSERTVERDWAYARAWLFRALKERPPR